MSTTTQKDPFAGYVPYGPEWQAYMMRQPKALIVEVATGIANEMYRLKAEKKELLGFLEMIANGGINAAGEATIEAEARALIAEATHP